MTYIHPQSVDRVSLHNLQSSTTSACSWQGTCSRTGQPASNFSTSNSAGFLSMPWQLTAEEALQVLKRLFSPAQTLGLPPLVLLWLQNYVILLLCLSDHLSNLQFRLVSTASFYQINKTYQRCLPYGIKYWQQRTIMKFGVWCISKGLPKPHRNSPKDKYFNQKRIKGATIISPNGNLNQTAHEQPCER